MLKIYLFRFKCRVKGFHFMDHLCVYVVQNLKLVVEMLSQAFDQKNIIVASIVLCGCIVTFILPLCDFQKSIVDQWC